MEDKAGTSYPAELNGKIILLELLRVMYLLYSTFYFNLKSAVKVNNMVDAFEMCTVRYLNS